MKPVQEKSQFFFQFFRPKVAMFWPSRSTKLYYVSTFSAEFFCMFRVFRPNFGSFWTLDPTEKCSTFFDPIQIWFHYLSCLRQFWKVFFRPRVDLFRSFRPTMGKFRLSGHKFRLFWPKLGMFRLYSTNVLTALDLCSDCDWAIFQLSRP